jgi:hypothetical protein
VDTVWCCQSVGSGYRLVLSVGREWIPSGAVSRRFLRPGGSVGIATGYGLDGPGIESRWGRDFLHLSRPALGPTQPSVQSVLLFPGGRKRPRRDADPSPLLLPRSKNRVELYLYYP